MTADEDFQDVSANVLAYWQVHADFTRAALRRTAWMAAPWWKRALTCAYYMMRHPKWPEPVVWTRGDEAVLADLRALSTHRFSALSQADTRLAAGFVCECGSPEKFVAAVDEMNEMIAGVR